ncbi:DMT family transporter [Rhodovulum sp. YNF3179]|uniref:DMT family transporter n=1 Tax=Rhodovulum sp. YNF3179 TaxID=3425127 RepID=UPI003D3498A6
MTQGGANLRGALFGLAAFGIFATHDVIVKVLGGTYAPVQLLFFSVLLSFPLVTLMLLHDRADENLRPRHPWWTALRTGAVVVTGLSAFYAFATLPLAQVYAILFASPLIVTVLSIPILGERVRLRRWLAVIVGLAGVLVVLRPGDSALGAGHVAALAAALGGATASVVVRRIGHLERNAVLLLYPMVANFAVMAVALPFFYRPMPASDLGLIALVAVLGFAAMLCLITAYKTGEAGVIAPMQYSQILWATGYGIFFFGERPDPATALGAALIIGSGLYILVREGRAGSAHRPVSGSLQPRFEAGILPRVGVWLRFRRSRSQ